MSDKLCSMPNCAEPPRANQRYCKSCHSLYMKAWRAKRRREEKELRSAIVKLRKKLVEQQRELEALRANG